MHTLARMHLITHARRMHLPTRARLKTCRAALTNVYVYACKTMYTSKLVRANVRSDGPCRG